MNGTYRRRAMQVAGVVLAAAIIIAVAASVRRNGPAAVEAWRQTQVQWAWVAVAAVCGLLGHALNVVGWRRVLRDCSVRIGWFETARFFAVSNLGRYLPGGKAWQLGMVAAMAKEAGMPVATLTATSFFGGGVGVLVGLLILLATAGPILSVSPWLVAIPVLGVVALTFGPAALRAAPAVLERITSRVPQAATITVGTMWALVWTAAASWLMWGIGLYALGLALLPAPSGSPYSFIVAWVGSFLAGILAFVSPAGIGAREVFMEAVLTRSGLSAGAALLVVAVARVGATALDVLPALAILVLRRWFNTANAIRDSVIAPRQAELNK